MKLELFSLFDCLIVILIYSCVASCYEIDRYFSSCQTLATWVFMLDRAWYVMYVGCSDAG